MTDQFMKDRLTDIVEKYRGDPLRLFLSFPPYACRHPIGFHRIMTEIKTEVCCDV